TNFIPLINKYIVHYIWIFTLVRLEIALDKTVAVNNVNFGARWAGIFGRKIKLIEIALFLTECQGRFNLPLAPVCSLAITIVPCSAPSLASLWASIWVDIVFSLKITGFPMTSVDKLRLMENSLNICSSFSSPLVDDILPTPL